MEDQKIYKIELGDAVELQVGELRDPRELLQDFLAIPVIKKWSEIAGVKKDE